eukprot:COSAG04_NODE_25825_length_303_cov_0.401961_1_plen_37_part_01
MFGGITTVVRLRPPAAAVHGPCYIRFYNGNTACPGSG